MSANATIDFSVALPAASRMLGAMRIPSQDREDCLQDVALALLKGQRGATCVDLSAYSAGIARHAGFDVIFRLVFQRNRETEVSACLATSREDAEKSLLEEERRRAVTLALKGLPQRQRAIIQRFYLEGASHATICAELGISRKALDLSKSRGIALLRERVAALLSRS